MSHHALTTCAVALPRRRALRAHLVVDHGRLEQDLDDVTLEVVHALEHFDYGDGFVVADHARGLDDPLAPA